MQISVEHTISMGHRLPGYEGICASPHGHNVKVVVYVVCHEGFTDFKTLSLHLKTILADFDHAMVLFDDDPLVPILRGFNFRLVTLNTPPTTEAIAQYIYNEFSRHDCAKFTTWAVDVHETDKYIASCTEFSKQVERVS